MPLRFRLSPRAQRRLQRGRDQLFWFLGYPIYLPGTLFRETGALVGRWWTHRNLRFLLQGLPAVLLAVGVLTFGVLVYFQDRNLLASEYKIQGQRSLYDYGNLLRANKDASANLAEA